MITDTFILGARAGRMLAYGRANDEWTLHVVFGACIGCFLNVLAGARACGWPDDCLPIASRLLADCLPIASRLLADCLPIACRLLAGLRSSSTSSR